MVGRGIEESSPMRPESDVIFEEKATGRIEDEAG